MDDENKEDNEVVNDSQIDLVKIRESRLQRTRETMMEFDRDIANSVIPDNNREDSLSVAERAAVSLQKHFRGYLGRKQYREKLLEQYEKDEEERQKKQRQQTEEAEILVERARLQLEAEEDNTIHRNKQRMLDVYATRIQRAWRQYVANRSPRPIHQGDSFEDQVYQATGLNVTDVITGNVMLANTVPGQSETILTDAHTSSSLHDINADCKVSVPATLIEHTKEDSSPKLEDMQTVDRSSLEVNSTNESKEDIVNKSNPNNEEVQQEEDTTFNDNNNISQDTDLTTKDVVRDDTVAKDSVQVEDTVTVNNVTTQRSEKKVRFNLQDNEDKEELTFTHSTLQSVTTELNKLMTSSELNKLTTSSELDEDSSSNNEDTLIMPAERVKQLGYTQLRELKCSLETKLGSLSDQLITELQSRDRLLAHKDFLLEKIQNLSKLVQNQHQLNQKYRNRIKSSGN